MPIPITGMDYSKAFDHSGHFTVSSEFRQDNGRCANETRQGLCVKLNESGAGRFSRQLADLSAFTNHDHVVINGCLQSWRYFQEDEQEIKHMLRFKSVVYEAAAQRIIDSFYRKRWMSRFNRIPLKVGIHVRRSDFIHPDNILIGFTTATKIYFQNAISYLEKKLRPWPLVFFVLSDDEAYCRDLFRRDNFHVVPQGSPESDMALFHLMDHAIISTGTFGWWSAYLSYADTTVYYKRFPKPESRLSEEYLPEDYFIPG